MFYRRNLEIEHKAYNKKLFWCLNFQRQTQVYVQTFKYICILDSQFLASGLLSSISVSDVEHVN